MLVDALAPYLHGHSEEKSVKQGFCKALEEYVPLQEHVPLPHALGDTIEAVLCGAPPPRTLQSVYLDMRAVAHVHGMPDVVMDEACAHICSGISKAMRALHDPAMQPVAWMQLLLTIWSALRTRLQLIRDLLRPVSVYTAYGDMESACTDMLKRACLDTPIKTVWGTGLYKMGELARSGKCAPSALREAVSIAQTMEFPTHALVDEAHAFYRSRGIELVNKKPALLAKEIPKLQAWIEREQVWSAWLGNAAVPNAVAAHIIQPHASLLTSTLPTLFNAHDFASLASLYRVFSSSHVLPQLYEAIRKVIDAQIKALLTDSSDDVLMERLMGVIDAWLDAWTSALEGDLQLRQALRDGLESACSLQSARLAKLLAQFCDEHLQSGKGVQGASLNQCMDDIVLVFRCLHDKDLFESLYKSAMAWRLLLHKYTLDDEHAMLVRLHRECGPDYTRKLETMLKDMSISHDLQDSFDENGGHDSLPFAFEAHVLTQAHWPSFDDVSLALPPAMADAIERYEAFYGTHHSGRSLHWRHALGSVVIHADLGRAGVKELVVSTPQAAVLLAFASRDTLTFCELAHTTQMKFPELKLTLQSLACGTPTTRILRKDSPGEDVGEEDVFRVNEDLSNTSSQIRIDQVQRSEAPEERHKTTGHVLIERDVVLQAATMRIMKAHKIMSFADLTTAVVEQLQSRFTVELSELKHTFERLIEKDCMERVEGERDMYQYVA